MRIALVGMKTPSEPDPDEAPLLAALRRAGHDAEVIAWDAGDDGRHDPAGFDACLLRATWNYHLQPGAFVTWIDRAAATSTLLNPAEVVRWNMHKRYLVELAGRGVATVPTVCLERGEPPDPAAVLRARGWDDVVIKPAVSAASWQTRRFGAGAGGAAETFLAAMLAERDMLVQPYMREVESGGETALVWIDGAVTHAVGKSPRFHDAGERVTARPELTDRHRRFAEQVLDAAGKSVLYARIDVIEGTGGEVMLSELELIEPSLYFDHSSAAVDRYVGAVERWVGASDS